MTGKKIKVLGVSGSLRRASLNTALLRVAIEMAPEELEITECSLHDLPMYNADVEAQGDPPAVLALKEAIRASDALLIASPEHNHSITAALKNALDWASRAAGHPQGSALSRKPVAIMGAGGIAGTARGQLHLRQVLAETRSLVMVEPSVFVTLARTKFDQDLKLTDEPTRNALRAFMQAIPDWVRFVQAGREAVTAANAGRAQ